MSDSITPNDIMLNEIDEINVVTKDTILVSEILSIEEISSPTILPMPLDENEVFSNNMTVCDDLADYLEPRNLFISFSDTPQLGNDMAIKFKNELSILPNILSCNEHTKQSVPTMDNTFVPILPSEQISGQNKYGIVSENETENEYEVITIAQNTVQPRQRKQFGIKMQPVQTSSRCLTNRNKFILGLTVAILITIISVGSMLSTLIKKPMEVMNKSITLSDGNYTVVRVNDTLKGYSQNYILSDKFIGITAKSKPARIRFPLIPFPLDLGNVSFNSGVERDIVHNIKCPKDGVHFLSVSVMSYDMKLERITIHVLKNAYKFIRLAMGAFTKDYAADDHAFIYCKKGDTFTIRYHYLDFPAIVWTPKATITLMFIAPSGEKVNGFYGRQFIEHQACTKKGESKFDTTMFKDTLFKKNKFTCPVKGIYLVMASYVTQQIQATVTIVKKRQPIMSLAFTENRKKGIFMDFYTSASNIVIVKCLAKDKLLLKRVDGAYRCNVAHKARIVFSAILIHRDGGEKTFVGVSAWKKSIQEYRCNDIITFDSVLLNEGGSFDINTSRFVCPHTGFYYTALTVRKVKDKPVRLSLQHGNKSVFKIEHLYRDQPYGMMSTSSLLTCREGEEIYVMGIGDGRVYGSKKHVITTVTIILMQKN